MYASTTYYVYFKGKRPRIEEDLVESDDGVDKFLSNSADIPKDAPDPKEPVQIPSIKVRLSLTLLFRIILIMDISQEAPVTQVVPMDIDPGKFAPCSI